MSSSYRYPISLQAPLLLLAILLVAPGGINAQLSLDFYKNSCPNAGALIKQAVTARFNEDSFAIPSTLRLCFHDAFAGNGIDGSILITGGQSEQVAEGNTDLAPNGFMAIQSVKTAVEAKCKGIVSCADILAQACRDVVVLAGGPSWDVKFGRRDSRVATTSQVHLPGADSSLDDIEARFSKLGLGRTDVVALSGAHTVGFAHCHSFANRLYRFNSTVKQDPSLDSVLAKQLKDFCPDDPESDNVVPLDPSNTGDLGTFTFDRTFYRSLRKGRSVLASDQLLWDDARTRGRVRRFANSTAAFFTAFADAMVRLSDANVLTGSQGEVRLVCNQINNIKKS